MRMTEERLDDIRANVAEDASWQHTRELLAELAEARDALSAIRTHHVELNRSRGRAIENSQTIALCVRGLGEAA